MNEVKFFRLASAEPFLPATTFPTYPGTLEPLREFFRDDAVTEWTAEVELFAASDTGTTPLYLAIVRVPTFRAYQQAQILSHGAASEWVESWEIRSMLEAASRAVVIQDGKEALSGRGWAYFFDVPAWQQAQAEAEQDSEPTEAATT